MPTRPREGEGEEDARVVKTHRLWTRVEFAFTPKRGRRLAKVFSVLYMFAWSPRRGGWCVIV